MAKKKEPKLSKFREANTVLVEDPTTGIKHRVFKGEADIVKKGFAKKAAAEKAAKAEKK